MDNGFPWKRFLEGFFVVAMLLFLDPAIYWSILLPCAIHHGGYKHELLSVQYVDFGRRQGGLHAAGSIQFAEACGTLLGDEGRRKEKVALPIGSGKSSCGKTIPVWVNRAYSYRPSIMALNRRVVHDEHMRVWRRYFFIFLLVYWPLFFLYCYMTITKRTVLYLLIRCWNGIPNE